MSVVVIDLAAAVVCALFICIAEHLVDVINELGQFVPWAELGLNLRLSPSSLHTQNQCVKLLYKNVLSQCFKSWHTYTCHFFSLPIFQCAVLPLLCTRNGYPFEF